MAKPPRNSVRLVAGMGIEGDVHAGPTVKHRSRLRRGGEQANLRQVHLLQGELHDELASLGFPLAAGQMGENILTRGLDLLGLPRGTRLRLGPEAVVELTGLRTPCSQLDGIQHGLMAAVVDRDDQGALVRRAGVMSVVLVGGLVRPDDTVEVELPAGPPRPLPPV